MKVRCWVQVLQSRMQGCQIQFQWELSQAYRTFNICMKFLAIFRVQKIGNWVMNRD